MKLRERDERLKNKDGMAVVNYWCDCWKIRPNERIIKDV